MSKGSNGLKGKGDRADSGTPLVSVIIPAYNHARYLGEAIESVLSQTVQDFEIVVIDDGSTDNTAEVVAHYPQVRYHKQANQGLSAARNTGIRESSGRFLLFLDADDRILPHAIEAGLACFGKERRWGFVSGRYRLVTVDGKPIPGTPRAPVTGDHYLAFLRGNYIGMHATVLYQRHVFDKVGTFSTQLRACEDYDMYLRVAREFPVATHEELVAEYRMHGSNMSGDLALMLRSVTRVLNLQLPYIRHDVARMNAYREGLEGWREHYTPKMLDQIGILRQTAAGRRKLPRLILTYLQLAPSTLTRLGLEEGKVKLRSKLRKAIPDAIRRAVRPKEDPGEVPFGRVNFGDLRRLTPISRHYGFDRGLPIDRHYIERFLGAHSGAIKGRVLEVGGNDYTVRFGGKQVSQADVLHVQEGNPQATFVGDLATADHLPDNAFDCVVLTQTLHLIYDVPAALATLHRILKPGGVLLMTVPGTISQIEQGDWTNYWHWGFTERSIRKLCEAQFAAPEVNVEVHGNVLTSIAFLHGVAAGELTAPELDARDPLYPLLITIHARKASPR